MRSRTKVDVDEFEREAAELRKYRKGLPHFTDKENQPEPVPGCQWKWRPGWGWANTPIRPCGACHESPQRRVRGTKPERRPKHWPPPPEPPTWGRVWSRVDLFVTTFGFDHPRQIYAAPNRWNAVPPPQRDVRTVVDRELEDVALRRLARTCARYRAAIDAHLLPSARPNSVASPHIAARGRNASVVLFSPGQRRGIAFGVLGRRCCEFDADVAIISEDRAFAENFLPWRTNPCPPQRH